MIKKIAVFGIRGDTQACPQDTIESFWAALSAGATGLAIFVSQTKDGILVCSNQAHVSLLQPEMLKISELEYSEIQKIDFGAIFQATNKNFNSDKNNTIHYPWMHNIDKNTGKTKFDALSISTLENVLSLFSRRTQLSFYLEDFNKTNKNETFINDVVCLLKRFNINLHSYLIASFKTCQTIKKNKIPTLCSILHADESNLKKSITNAKSLAIKSIYLPLDLIVKNQQLLKTALNLCLNANINIQAYCETFPDRLSFELLQSSKINNISIYTSSVLKSMNFLSTRTLMIEDSLKCTKMSRNTWSAGYSNNNNETEIIQNNGINIKIQSGHVDSGAAIVLQYPITGNFDASITFTVTNPTQGSSFELAAISNDPGKFDINNLKPNTVHPSFDMNGTPPYASAQYNQDNGFRCAWNNSMTTVIINSDNEMLANNIFNHCGRNVGNTEKENTSGKLRLIRRGAIFSSYYKDKYNSNWVNSGSMLVATLASDVFIRLAAKHWPIKNNAAPFNNIIFSDFKLLQE